MADGKVTVIAAVVILGLLLLVILLPISFSDVEYYEFAFKKRKSTGFVDTENVYTSGRHLIGPDFTFKKFRSDAHFEEMNKIAVFTSDKVEITITCNFQYFLRKEFLPDLHEAYNVDYKPVIRSTAIDAIKGRAAQLAVDDYIRNREYIERELFKQLALRVDGCCRKTCPKDLSEIACGRCIELKDCKSNQKGLFVEMRYFQLLAVDVHSDVKSRYLRQVTEAAEEERAEFELQEKVERKKTEREKNVFINEANEISKNATAQATLTRSKAKAEALKIVEKARADGLESLFNAVGLSSDPERSSFNYLRALRNKKDVSIAVGYQNLYARAP